MSDTPSRTAYGGDPTPKVWSVIVDFLADDSKQATQRRNEIMCALDDMSERIGPVSVSTVAEVAPLVTFEMEDVDGL